MVIKGKSNIVNSNFVGPLIYNVYKYRLMSMGSALILAFL